LQITIFTPGNLRGYFYNQTTQPMNILNKGFKPFAENGSVTIYTKVLNGKITPEREKRINNWIDALNKKTEHVCYGLFYMDKWVKEYHINIEVLNSNEL